MKNPFRYFKTSPEIIRLAVIMYVRFPLSLRNVENLLHERGGDISHETIQFWWNRFGPMFASKIRKKRTTASRHQRQWRWHLDEASVRIHGKTYCRYVGTQYTCPYVLFSSFRTLFESSQTAKMVLVRWPLPLLAV